MNLYIDTHLDDIVIILFDGKKIIKEEKIKSKTKNSTLTMPTIKKILKDDLPNSIIVCNGPGSFTGVRLAVTIAKTLAYTLNIPIRTITSLESIALSIEDKEKIVAFSDKNGYYIAIFDSATKLIGNYEYLTNDEFNEYSKDHQVYTNITLDYNKILTYALKKDTLNPHSVKPLYIKKLDVEK